MPVVLSLLFMIIAVSVIVAFIKRKNPLEIIKSPLFIIIGGGIAVRLLATLIVDGHTTDMTCFKAWAGMLFNDGFKSFYASSGFTDYPPGYMYVLFVIGFLSDLFGFSFTDYSFSLLIKLPAILADVFAGVFIYKIATARFDKENTLTPLTIACLYVFNPAVIFISSVWGQVDAIHTVVILVSIYMLTEKKLLYALLLFSVSVIIKPQSFMFTPIYLFAMFVFIKENFSLKAFCKLLAYALLCFGLCAVFLIPFINLPIVSFVEGKTILTPVLQQYIDTLASYPYCTVNAYNIYALFGLNWTPATEPFLFLSYEVWGYVYLVIIVLISFIMLLKSKDKWNYFFTAAFICASVFMFSIKMHERYNFPVFLILVAAYIYSKNKRIIYLYVVYTISAFLNYADVLRMTLDDFNYPIIDSTSRIFSFIAVAVFAYFVYVAVNAVRKNTSDVPEKVLFWRSKVNNVFEIKPSEQYSKYTKKDFILLASLTLVYALLAFSNLGNLNSPETSWEPDIGQYIYADFGNPVQLSRVQIYNGAKPNHKLDISFSQDGVNFDYLLSLESGSIFRWSERTISSEIQYRYVKITAESSQLMLMELAFRDVNGNVITPVIINGDMDSGIYLFDEQNFVPEQEDYMNSTYFDEVYHPRTAYEFVRGMPVYETSHPQLGKLIIAVGIKIFGMNPFGWRFMGALFGVLMLPLIYAFARRLLKTPFFAFFVTFIFTFDFMHYAQTRLATIDTYVVFFIIGMYYFMYKYFTMNFYDTKLSKTLVPLGLSGLFMGLGIASKWPGVYAGVGLAVLFFITIARRYMEYRYAATNRLPGYKKFYKYTIITFAFCILFFIIIPLIIYVLSYVPYYFHCNDLYPIRSTIPFLNESAFWARMFPDNTLGNFLAAIVQNQINMFGYHSGLEATHPYSSVWWTWPLNIRPIWYYSQDVSETLKQGISAFGNPAVWWTGIVALFYCMLKWIKTRDRKIMFIVIAYFTQLAPWMLVSRIVFIYHYFPCVPFVTLLVGWMFKDIYNSNSINTKIPFKLGNKNLIITGKTLSYLFIIITGLLFIMFYPVLTGIPVNFELARKILRWLPSWVLV